jgi:ApaG protein
MAGAFLKGVAKLAFSQVALPLMSNPQFTVQVAPQYLPEQSAPDDAMYVFAYTITITNTGDIAAQVISRTWNVNDSNGLTEKVKGLGVVGQQPFLKPGQAFEYTSGTRLRTPTGTMHGSLFCVAEDGDKFDADIPMFVLDALSEPGARTLH